MSARVERMYPKYAAGLRLSYSPVDPDELPRPVLFYRIDKGEKDDELPMHQHRKGQLVMALRGSVTCEVNDGLWMVPPHCAVWVPGGVAHSNHISANGRVYCVFVEPDEAPLPKCCCTLAITPLVREMILHLAQLPLLYPTQGPTSRLVRVLLDELVQMPVEHLHLPLSGDVRLRQVAEALMANPANRASLTEWGARLAMSERTFSRFVLRETGMTFGRWRQQLHIIVALQRLAAGASVQVVSQDLGYESVSAFITMFKKALGKTPGRYLPDRADDDDGPSARILGAS